MICDQVIYINLDKRTDRRQEMEQEFKRIGIPESKIFRLSATLKEGKGPLGGSFGCTLSHIAALKHAQSLPDDIKTVIILEDDFNFADDVDMVRQSLEKFLAYPRDSWDLALLSYHVLHSEPHDDLVSLALYSHGTAGYIVNRSAIPGLLAVLEESRDGLTRTGAEQYVIDVYWHHFMKNRKCFYFNNPLGYQRESFSDIQQMVMLNRSYVG